MVTWEQIIKDPDFQALPPSGQDIVREGWFDSVAAPKLRKAGLDEDNLNAIRSRNLTSYDNG